MRGRNELLIPLNSCSGQTFNNCQNFFDGNRANQFIIDGQFIIIFHRYQFQIGSIDDCQNLAFESRCLRFDNFPDRETRCRGNVNNKGRVQIFKNRRSCLIGICHGGNVDLLADPAEICANMLRGKHRPRRAERNSSKAR